MPDYNPAVATGIQTGGGNFAGTLDTIANLQRTQAATGLTQLQAIAAQRDYNALQAYSQATQAGEDGLQAAMKLGPSPTMMNGLQTFEANRRAMGTNSLGIMPEQNVQRLQGQKVQAEIPGAIAGSQKAQTEASEEDTKFRGQLGNQLAASPTQETLRNLLPQFVGHVSDNGMKELMTLAAGKEDQGAIGSAATRMIAAVTPSKDLTSVINPGQSAAPAQPATAGQPGQQAQTAAGPSLRPPGQAKQMEEQAGYYNKVYSGISALGNTSAASLDDIRLAKAAINDPNFWSGTGETYNLMYKRALALGGDTAALPQEVFKKIMNANVLQQVNGLKAAQEEMGATGGGRIFQAQIDMMQKAAQNPENTIAANRFLTEIAERTANKNIKLADSAADYKGGKLDPQFEKQFRQNVGSPMFSPWELSHLNTVGAPMADKIKQIDPREIQHLKDNPGNAGKFDAYYGPGTSRAALAQ